MSVKYALSFMIGSEKWYVGYNFENTRTYNYAYWFDSVEDAAKFKATYHEKELPMLIESFTL